MRAEDARGIQYEYNTEVCPMQNCWQQAFQSHAIYSSPHVPSLRQVGLLVGERPEKE